MADHDADYHFAMALQSALDCEPEEQTISKPPSNCVDLLGKPHTAALDTTVNIVHPEWELIDPTPDVTSMFKRFDDKFFSNKLKCVELEWSKKMYSCAGICYSRRNRFGMSVTIRLSEPLLKLRSRKNLVETLLHEMIHAYCFVLGIREGNGGHGPNFVRMMQNINKVAGTNITVYHTFHDEVNEYKKHVWRCNGICQHRRPFFGYVKRTMNRPPGQSDNWWRTHQEACGGYFQKISEPEKAARNKKKSKKDNAVKENTKSIKDFLIPGSKKSAAVPKPLAVGAGVSVPKSVPSAKPSATSNIVTFCDLTDSSSSPELEKAPPNRALFTGAGHKLATKTTEIEQLKSIQEKVRNSWKKRYGCNSSNENSPKKRTRLEAPSFNVAAPSTNTSWEELDSDIFVLPNRPEIIVLDDSDNDSDEDFKAHVKQIDDLSKQSKTAVERSNRVRDEIMEEASSSDESIEMIDGEFDDTIAVDNEIDESVVSDFISDDSLMKEFIERNGSGLVQDPDFDFVSCPICQCSLVRSHLAEHMEEGCLGIRIHVNAPKLNIKDYLNSKKASKRKQNSSIVSSGESETEAVTRPENSDDVPETRFPCPICGIRFSEDRMNAHLDGCIS